MKKIVLLIFILFSIGANAQTTGIAFEKGNWYSILQKAKAEKKLIFLDAYTSWCGPCKRMQAYVFPDKKLGDYFNANFVNAKIDMEQGEGPAIGMKYPVKGYPTLFFIDPNTGKIVKENLGGLTVDQLYKLGEDLQKSKKSSI
ncbi:MAG: thioredoxin [Bacteroidetes bacterium]|nr:thioredoxin [Bacteroidota bacterium]